jgi:dienelactone hydrolase
MNDLLLRDVEYSHDGTRMIGALCAPAGAVAAPAVLLVHDAFGVSTAMLDVARGLAELGLAVFVADVWGDRTLPASEEEIGALIGAMVADRPRWAARVAAAHEATAAQEEVDSRAVVAVGYCFGGSSVLEHLRTGGDLRGAVAVHAGLDLLDPAADWSAADPRSSVLLCTGADDPMALPAQRTVLLDALDTAGLDWELNLYSGTVHAFTSPRAAASPRPDVVAYHPRSAARAWQATTRFLHERFPALTVTAHTADRTPTATGHR